jgi:hypothetical protein
MNYASLILTPNCVDCAGIVKGKKGKDIPVIGHGGP